ncbi:YbhB/YbcL family Raf kinase inhibitor-like protein [Marinitenerispora sediminis]|uniref:Phosphatidylethanolamine-binding protein n=1 Tax=Marinitenerispora sediminis TaxID=1931232 RepID=A0A368T1N2_9ACTN|nr:YbhB/YbcL family Raf kinase inhibitor-like protein [Marinitenerispora sediminis]RCV47531.1 phosphatidylethanolamine-binding protein [Marinitenerispora sediminis]RCV47793.1 phosphatidylethanolamine-binding protein [Marinitenerispora sediminis]RCV48895.1 phosphatidylethanolamine-binding protein [Marinitenerispora sediminis]
MFPVPRHASPASRHRGGSRAPAATGGVAVLMAVATGCGVLPTGTNAEATDDITVTSPMIREGETIPERYTCEGEGVSPPLRWSGLPSGTESLAVLVDDTEASGGAQVYWVVYGLDPENPELPEGSVPQPGHQAQNSVGAADYEPPCPEGDEDHEYRFTVYALSEDVPLSDGAPLDEALGAIAARTLARGRLIATGG